MSNPDQAASVGGELAVFRRLADAAYDAVLITDAQIDSPGPRIVYVNESLCQMTGYRPEELIGQTPRIFQGPETDRAVLDELRICLEQGRAFEGSTVNYRRDGSPYLLQWKTEPVLGKTGHPSYFVSVQKDLTHLIRAESFSDTLLKSLGEGVFGIDCEGRFTFLNPQALATLGYASQDQLLGRPSHEMIHTDPSGRHSHPIEKCLIHRVLRSGQRLDAQEDTYFRADGTPVPVEVYAAPIHTLDRRLDGVVGVFRDISERVAARRALQERNERLENVIVGANAGTWEWDLESDALTVNDIWLHLLGLDRVDVEPLYGEDWRQRVHPEDWPLVERQIQRYLHGEEPYYEVEFRMRHADGHWVWLLARGKVNARGPGGEPLRFSGTHLDVSAIKRSEHARLDSQRKYRALFDAMNDVALVYPFEAEGFGRFAEVNQEACRQLGYSREELLSKRPGDLFAAEMTRHFDQVTWREEFRWRGHDRIETTFERADGCHVPYEMSLRLFDYDGEAMVLAIARDVSDRHRWEADLLRSTVVFDSSDEGIVVTDARSRIISVNPAFERVTGYSRDEVLGKNPKLLSSGRHDQHFYDDMWDALLTRGRWQGEIWNRRKDGELILEWQTINAVRDADGRIVNYISVFSDITRAKQSEEAIRFLTEFDPLTHLPNWSQFTRRLSEMLPEAGEATLVHLDLNRFKSVNDGFGHATGDQVLKRVAAVLDERVRPPHLAARFSADEFAVLLKGADQTAAEAFAQSLLEWLAEPFWISKTEMFMTASIGIAVSSQAEGDPTVLIRQAQAALDHAKADGRGAVRVFEAGMAESRREELILEGALKRALENRELICHYQPQVNMATGQLLGLEVLVRWQSPEMGLISPGRFIPVAETTGLIVSLGEYVLREACEQYMVWCGQGMKPGRMAVNVSGRQLRSGSLVSLVQTVLEETGMPPEWLELEITETYLVEDLAVLPILGDLKALGVRLSIDDFGTGHSSLARLKELPVDKLKIDQSFVRDLSGEENDQAIVRAIMALGGSMGLEVLAEGVETQSQCRFLQSLGCHMAQGYLFSRPLPASDVPLQDGFEGCAPSS